MKHCVSRRSSKRAENMMCEYGMYLKAEKYRVGFTKHASIDSTVSILSSGRAANANETGGQEKKNADLTQPLENKLRLR